MVDNRNSENRSRWKHRCLVSLFLVGVAALDGFHQSPLCEQCTVSLPNERFQSQVETIGFLPAQNPFDLSGIEDWNSQTTIDVNDR